MMPSPRRYTGTHCADFQSSFGWRGLSLNAKLMPISTYPMAMQTPSFHTIVQPDQKMIMLAMKNAIGDQKLAAGSRYARGRSLWCSLNTPTASGAPAYISRLASVTSSTRSCQLGNGRKKMSEARKAKNRLNQGTPLGLVVSEM